MLINMRNGLMAGGGLSARSYVQDGLVAMWDGIESQKGGTWQNLVKSSPVNHMSAPLSPGVLEVVDNGYKFTNANYVYGLTATHRLANLSAMTIEVVTDGMSGSDSNAKSFGFNVSSNVYARQYWRNNILLYNWTGYWSNVTSMAPATVKCFGAIWESNGTVSAMNNGSVIFTNNAGAVGNISPSHSYEFYLMRYWAGSYTQYLTSGTVHACRLYSRALTDAEIAANYAVDKARFNLPDAT